MNDISLALGVLSAMITPAVLISACGSLIIATSNRLGRAVDRVRALAGEFEELTDREEEGELLDERRAVLFALLNRAIRRSRLLQRAMNRLYLALSIFVATSVAIGISAVLEQEFAWVAIVFGLSGAGALFHASVLLITESRDTLAAVDAEMDWIWKRGQIQAPNALLERRRARSEEES